MVQFATDKLRGGYYTKPEIAEWLCRWCIRRGSDTVLEPSCGDGVFLEAAAKRFASLDMQNGEISKQMKGIEIVSQEAQNAAERMARVLGPDASGCVQCAEFFDWHRTHPDESYNCVVGNPPFIRYQNFAEPARTIAMRLMADSGLKPNRLTNIWVPFVVAAVQKLRDHGRLAMVLPAELLQVSYAAQLRGYLVDTFEAIDLIACNELFFENAQQEVVLLLADGKLSKRSQDHSCSVDLLQFERIRTVLSTDPRQIGNSRAEKAVRHGSEKWLKYFLSSAEIELMRNLRGSEQIAQLGEYASVDIGVVTGNNRFFALNRDDVERWRVEDHVTPLVGRSYQLRGAIIGKAEWEHLARAGQKAFLFSIELAEDARIPAGARDYVAFGEEQGVHKGYKCSIRKHWYTVPSVWLPDCFFFRQIHKFPRLVVNRAEATCTDTIHRMRCKAEAKLLASNVYTHLTAASAEIEGRSYGGGVLEIEPTEAERLLVPRSLGLGLTVEEIDKHVRVGELDLVLRKNDRLVLMRGLGLSKRDCSMLENIWRKMMERRRSRRRKPG